MPDLKGRLITFLIDRGLGTELVELHPDASTRGYYRIQWNGRTAVACVYPEELDPAVGTYVDVTALFLAGGLPVADIYDIDAETAVVVQEDMGDRIVRDEMISANADRKNELVDEAIALIARIQAATQLAYERESIASQLQFDAEKLSWELDYFKKHYFTTFRQSPLSDVDDRDLTNEFMQLSAELETYAAVLCHRDFHAANLMLDDGGRMRVIDHQDARIGSMAYDLVSLLLDRSTQLPTAEWLGGKLSYFLDKREEFGLPVTARNAFEREFKLQTMQRCLKAAGTFSYQSAVRGKTHFIPFIEPMFRATLNAAADLDRFPCIRTILARELA